MRISRLSFAIVVAAVLGAGPLAAQRRAAPAAAAPAATPAAAPAPAQSGDRALWRTMTDLRTECRATTQYLVWQWNRYARAGDVPRESPLFAFANAANAQGLADLTVGVQHNPQAVGVYRSCAAATSVEYLVYIAATASDRTCDMAAAQTNLLWQKQNALVSLNEAMRLWRAGRAAKSVAEENAGILRAMKEMYTAVRHNPTAGAVYRACFRDRPEDFMEAVRLLLDG